MNFLAGKHSLPTLFAAPLMILQQPKAEIVRSVTVSLHIKHHKTLVKDADSSADASYEWPDFA